MKRYVIFSILCAAVFLSVWPAAAEETGRSVTPVWEFATDAWVKSWPAVADGHVYFGSDDTKVYCVHSRTGERAGQVETGGAVFSSPLVTGGKADRQPPEFAKKAWSEQTHSAECC